MSDLRDLIEETPLFRRVIGERDFARRIALLCLKKERDAARSWLAGSGAGRPHFEIFLDEMEGSSSDIATIHKNPDILVVVYGRRERAKGLALAHHGLREFVFHADPNYSKTRYNPLYYHENRSELDELFSLLEDEESRRTFASVVKHRLTGDCGYLRIATYPEYQHPLVKAEIGDHVVDGGAFDGKTSATFAQNVGSNGRVYAFEPDPTNIRLIETRIQNLNQCESIGTLEIVQAALSSSDRMLSFSVGSLGSSHIGSRGEKNAIDVAARSLDSFLGDKHCDLISLDVEGAEAQVLAGAEQTIRRLKPKLQISLYHTPRHLFELPAMLKGSGYRFFMGHHNTYSTETDLYALSS